MVLGALAALPSYAVIVWRPRTRVDETLDVLAAHGIAGLTGILFIGFFAQASWNGVSDGLLYGNAEPARRPGARGARGPGLRVRRDLRAPARDRRSSCRCARPSARRRSGMDVVQHGEEAYATGEGAILVAP